LQQITEMMKYLGPLTIWYSVRHGYTYRN